MARLLQGEDSGSTGLCKQLPAQVARSNLNTIRSSLSRAAAQEQKDTGKGASPLPHTKCLLPAGILITKTPQKMTTGKTPTSFWYLGDTEGKGNSAACFRPQVAVISSSHISLSRAPRSSLELKPFITRMTK